MTCLRNICIIFLSMIFSAGCTDTESSQTSDNQVLLISFDGFGHDFLSRTSTPHFDSLVAKGVSSKGLIPVFPTKTFPNHYSIATGLYPENTGLVANTMYDPKFGGWYRISNREAVEDPEWYSGEPIWNTLEKQGLKAGTMFWVGSEAPIQDMRPTYWKRYNEDITEKARIDTVVKWLSYPRDRAVNFATLYFELVDATAHDYGLESDSLDAAIQKSDRLLGYLKQKLREVNKWESINLIILSDHGMVDVSSDKTIRLDTIIDMEDVDRITWAPATMIQPKEGKIEEIYRALKASEENYRVYRKENIPERYHIKNHRRVPDILVVADLGYTILNENYKDRFLQSLPSAMHGYDNNTKAMQALFTASGPAFAEGKKISSFQNIHVYELINHLLGTEPVPNDGSLDSVKVMLK